MKIELLQQNSSPSNVAVSAARTCYYPNGIIKPETSENWKNKNILLNDIFMAGHHTTLQHSYFTLLIEDVSRHFVWRFLHSHSFYNSEQVSQRYTKMKKDAYIIPKKINNIDISKEQNEKWEHFYCYCFDKYETLIQLLIPYFETTLPKHRKKEAIKKAQENARYVLPQGVTTYLYHTVNLMTLLRYISVGQQCIEIDEEAKEFVFLIEQELLKIDISLKPLIDKAKEQKFHFNESTITDPKNSLVEIINADPLENPLKQVNDLNYAGFLGLNQIQHDPLIVFGFTAKLKLSLCADAQNQRHRRSIGYRPPLQNINVDITKDNIKDFVFIPPVFNVIHPNLNSNILDIYLDTLINMYSFTKEQSKENFCYTLPNAHLITIQERNDYASFIHKSKMRLCLNAQEEIRFLTEKTIEELETFLDTTLTLATAPCKARFYHGIRPYCPEGNRYCGVPKWKEYEKYKS